MSTRALDSNGDWTFGSGINNYLTGNAEVAQNIKTRLQCFLGDCFFDTGMGVDWFNLLGSKQQVALQLSIAAVILNTQYVTGGLQLSVSYNEKTRGISIIFQVQTTYSQLTSQFVYDLSAFATTAS
jgi:hypothetical protein